MKPFNCVQLKLLILATLDTVLLHLNSYQYLKPFNWDKYNI